MEQFLSRLLSAPWSIASAWSLTLAVFAALVPEIAALALIYRRKLPAIQI